jgi:uncharacterized protein (TIGR02246 family)
MKYATFTAVLAMLLSLGMFSGATAQQMDAAAMRKVVAEESAKWMAAYNKGDAAGVAALYADDATVLPPNSEMVQGKQAIQDLWSSMMQTGLKEVKLTTVKVGGSGDTIYEIGQYTAKIQPQGGAGMTDPGKYIVVLKRQPEGTWKLAADIWNTSTPLPGE